VPWSGLARQQATLTDARRNAAWRAAGWTLLAMTVTALDFQVVPRRRAGAAG
jgi:hypothetical protein